MSGTIVLRDKSSGTLVSGEILEDKSDEWLVGVGASSGQHVSPGDKFRAYSSGHCVVYRDDDQRGHQEHKDLVEKCKDNACFE